MDAFSNPVFDDKPYIFCQKSLYLICNLCKFRSRYTCASAPVRRRRLLPWRTLCTHF